MKKIVIIGGGIGIFPLLEVTKRLGKKAIVLLGFRSAENVILEDEFAKYTDRIFVATEDGSCGYKGYITDLMRNILETNKVDRIYSCGPMPMMKAVADLTRGTGIKTEASMNPIMVDGTGMCGACRLTVGGKTKFACIDGPDFNAHEVDFDEVINRNKIYREQEHKRDEECNLFKQKVRG